MFKKTNIKLNIDKKINKDDISEELREENNDTLKSKYGYSDDDIEDRSFLRREKDRILRELVKEIGFGDKEVKETENKLKEIFKDAGVKYDEHGVEAFLEGFQAALSATSFDERLKKKDPDERGIAYPMCAMIFMVLENIKDQK